MSNYPKIGKYDSITIDPRKKMLTLACCDCGLVHRIMLTITKDGKITITFRDDKRSTAQLRRHNYGYLQQGKHPMYRMENKSRRVQG